jgi:ABC-type Fe3+-hydroxamate transport system substrate-binding protein
MASGRATFIGDMLQRIGIENVLSSNTRYPELSIQDVKRLNPEFIFLSSEPYPFNDTHIKELQKEIHKAKIILVDGELFSWYGSRLKNSVEYFNQLIVDLKRI